MPLKPGHSHAVISENIAELIRNGFEAEQAEAIAYKEAGLSRDVKANDEAPLGTKHLDIALATDGVSVRSYDVDGRLHVTRTPISKANICEYLGREIPGSQSLGLNPDQRYRLLRHPDELRKAADTFNNIPLLGIHTPVDAKRPGNHKPEHVVGATGTDAAYEHPYLVNSLVVWSKDDIDRIEADLKKELSSSYRYRADMTPGTYEGEKYDGIMRDLVANHVAVVKEGRAGPDVLVQDSMENLKMSKSAQARKRTFDALAAFFSPKLAADAKLDGLDAVILALDESEEDKKEREDKEAADKKAKDEAEAKEKADKEATDKKAKDAKRASDKKARDEAKEGFKEKLKDKLSAEDWKAACDELDDMSADEEDDEPVVGGGKGKGPAADRKKAKDEEMVDKKAMDSAIETRVAAERQRQRDVRDAERFVRPWVGDLTIAYDSAEDVYKAAIESTGKSVKDVHPSAYRSILEFIPKPGTERRTERTKLAMDAKAATSLEAICGPGVNTIRLN
jgi:uncharacterized protein